MQPAGPRPGRQAENRVAWESVSYYTGVVTDAYPLRPVTDDEFEPFARMIADTYGLDRSDEEIANQRAATELDRTIAAFDEGAPVGGASVYRRMLTVPGAVMPVAGIATVGVAPTHRRRGILTSMMRRQLNDLHEQHREAVAVLRPSEAAIYGRYGYGPASQGNQLRCAKSSMVFRSDADAGKGRIRLVPLAQARPLIEKIYDQVRAASVGWPDRGDSHWAVRLFDAPHTRRGATSLRFALHQEPDGQFTGYAFYRHKGGQDALGNDASAVLVEELAATSRSAYTSLWRFLGGIDLVSWIEYEGAMDEPLQHLLADPRSVSGSAVDRLWVRLVDVGRALAGRRYTTELDLVLDVEDTFCPWNAGRYRLRANGDDVTCARTEDPAELWLTSAELGAAFLGGTTLASLAAAGKVRELRPGALTRASAAFRHDREPFYPGGWAFPLY